MSVFSQLMMRKKKVAKTLNLTAVNGATYDSDYIFTNDGSYKYFETNEELDLLNINNEFTFIIKFQYSKTQNGIYRRENDYDFSGYINSVSQFFAIVNEEAYVTSNINNKNTWYWVKITRRIVGYNIFSAYYSLDGENYTNFRNLPNNINIQTPKKILYGIGTSMGTDYNFDGKIDFKECSIIINGEEKLWI